MFISDFRYLVFVFLDSKIIPFFSFFFFSSLPRDCTLHSGFDSPSEAVLIPKVALCIILSYILVAATLSLYVFLGSFLSFFLGNPFLVFFYRKRINTFPPFLAYFALERIVSTKSFLSTPSYLTQ